MTRTCCTCTRSTEDIRQAAIDLRRELRGVLERCEQGDGVRDQRRRALGGEFAIALVDEIAQPPDDGADPADLIRDALGQFKGFCAIDVAGHAQEPPERAEVIGGGRQGLIEFVRQRGRVLTHQSKPLRMHELQLQLARPRIVALADQQVDAVAAAGSGDHGGKEGEEIQESRVALGENLPGRKQSGFPVAERRELRADARYYAVLVLSQHHRRLLCGNREGARRGGTEAREPFQHRKPRLEERLDDVEIARLRGIVRHQAAQRGQMPVDTAVGGLHRGEIGAVRRQGISAGVALRLRQVVLQSAGLQENVV
ncbi:MAG: hypothetical protein WDM81_01170 [Rhizomicrobium sp.]